jgi:hypothetical protein
MFSKEQRKWKIQHGYDVSSTEKENKEEETCLQKKKQAPYLQAAKEELNTFDAPEKALRKLTRERSFEVRMSKALGHATDTLVKALKQEAEHKQYEYHTDSSLSTIPSSADLTIAEPAMQTSSVEDQLTVDPYVSDASHIEAPTEIPEVAIELEGDSIEPCSPVLMWQSSPSKKHKSHEGYIVRVQKKKESKKERTPLGYPDSHSMTTHLELNRVVEVEPCLPNDVKIVKRNGVNMIVSTVSPIPPNTEAITVTASDLQTCGTDLAMLRACMLKKDEGPTNIIEIILNKRYGEKLGVTVDFEDLRITSFHEGGVFTMWNDSNPESRVRIGSRILEANGKTDTLGKLKEMKDATYATTISLKIERVEGEPDEIVEVQEEEAEPYDPNSVWKDKPVIPCYSSNDSHINQVWFPPSPKESDDEEAAPREPRDKSRSDSCPPSSLRIRKGKLSLPPCAPSSAPNSRPRSRESSSAPSSRPRSRECSSAPSSAKESRHNQSASGSRDGQSRAPGSRPSSCGRRIPSNYQEPRSASACRVMSSSSSVEKLPPLA